MRTINASSMNLNRLLKPDKWPPLYAIINKLGLTLYDNLFLTPRILTSIFGILTSMSLMVLAHKLFRNNSISIITGILAIYFPHRLVFSVAPMSEIYFMFFITLGSAFAIGWITSNREYELLLSSICFLLSSAFRFEGGLFSATMVSILSVKRFITHKMGWRWYLINIAILSSFPLYYFLSAYFTKRMWVFSVHSQSYIYFYGTDLTNVWHRSYLYQFIKQSVYTPLIAGLISFTCLIIHDRKIRLWSLLVMIPLLGMTLLGFVRYTLPTHNWWRVASPALILLLPFLAHLVYTVSAAIYANRHMQYISLTVITAMFVVGFHSDSIKKTSRSNFTLDDLNVGRFLNNLKLENTDRILIDTSSWSYYHVIVASNMPKRFIRNTGSDPSKPLDGIINADRKIDINLLKNNGITYLVFSKRNINLIPKTKKQSPGKMRRVRNRPYTTVLNGSKDLRRIHQKGQWIIYALKQHIE